MMSDFKHSIVLFTGDDGLPLEFNVRNTVDKIHLKALIEYGGGFCSQNENSVHLISPNTKVLNVDTGKKLVSSSYIYDCVKENYLLDVNDYVFTIAEAQTSDISEENSEESVIQRHSTCKLPNKNTAEKMNFHISPIKSVSKNSFETGSTTPSNLTLSLSNAAAAPITNSSSTHSESFVEGTQEENCNVKIISHIYSENKPDEIYKSPEVLKSPEVMKSSKLISPFKDNNFQCLVSPKKCVIIKEAVLSSPRGLTLTDSNKLVSPVKVMEMCDNILSPKKSDNLLPNVVSSFGKSPVKIVEVNENVVKSPNIRENFTLRPVNELFRRSPSPIQFEDEQPDNGIHPYKLVEECKQVTTPTVVSSSQPDDELDKFDNMLLSKTQKKRLSENEDSLSQSYTVSSSADAQVSSKPCSSDVIAPELQKENTEPDSPSLISSQVNVPLYVKNLEEKVKELLKKSPDSLSIEDKATMVKYVCCVGRAEPAHVLHSIITGSDL